METTGGNRYLSPFGFYLTGNFRKNLFWYFLKSTICPNDSSLVPTLIHITIGFG